MYGGTFAAVPLNPNQYTLIAEIDVPAGVYIVTGRTELDISTSNIHTLHIDGYYGVRFSGSSGGGACVTNIVKTESPKKLELYLNGPTQNAKSRYTSFVAIKIK